MQSILIVEDDTTLREGLATALQTETRTIYTAADLTEARKRLRERTFDLLLVDYNLPDGSGIELCREVTAAGDVPVLFLTVRDAEIDEVTAFRASAWDYIKKPFSLTILQERMTAGTTEAFGQPYLRGQPVPVRFCNACLFRRRTAHPPQRHRTKAAGHIL